MQRRPDPRGSGRPRDRRDRSDHMERPARDRKVVLLAREDDGGGGTATLDRGLAPAAPEPHTKGADREFGRYHLGGAGRTQEVDPRRDAGPGPRGAGQLAGSP